MHFLCYKLQSEHCSWLSLGRWHHPHLRYSPAIWLWRNFFYYFHSSLTSPMSKTKTKEQWGKIFVHNFLFLFSIHRGAKREEEKWSQMGQKMSTTTIYIFILYHWKISLLFRAHSERREGAESESFNFLCLLLDNVIETIEISQHKIPDQH